MGLPRQTDTAALRVLRITELLFGNVLDGFSNKEIADALGYSPSNVCRDMELLRQAGWAHKLDSGRWAVTEKPVSLMQAYTFYMDDLARRRDQLPDSYCRSFSWTISRKPSSSKKKRPAAGVVLPPGPERPPRPPWNSRPQDWWPTCAATASPCPARNWRKVCIWPEPRA